MGDQSTETTTKPAIVKSSVSSSVVNKPAKSCLEQSYKGIKGGSRTLPSSKGFERPGKCPQCDINLDTSSYRAIQETCGHIKCRPCFIKNEEGCLQCRAANSTIQSQQSKEIPSISNEIEENTASSSNKCLSIISTKSKVAQDGAVILCEKQKTVMPKWTSRNKHLFNGIENESKSKNKNSGKEKGNGYLCELCDRSFPSKSYFEYHNRTHTGERPFPCSNCNKSFNSSYQLSRHMFIHNGESTSICSFCDKKFVTKDALIIHLRNHTNEKPFACDKCDKKYPSQASLNRHSATHAETKCFLCCECGKTFMSNNTLSAHMLSHLRERNFPCDLCRSRFKKQIDLDRHQLSHRELKRIPCPLSLCKRRFRRKDNLIRHLKVMHDLTKEEANESFKSVNFESTNSLLCTTGAETNNSESEEINIEIPEKNSQNETVSGLGNIDDSQETYNRVAALSIDTSSVMFPNQIDTVHKEENESYKGERCPKINQVSTTIGSLPDAAQSNSKAPKVQERNFNATSVIRTVESLDPRYQNKQYNNQTQDLVVSTLTPEDQQPNSIQTNYYYTPGVRNPYETSVLRNGVGHLASNNAMDSYRNPRSTVIDNASSSSLFLNIHCQNPYPFKEYSTPEIPYVRTEYIPRDSITQEMPFHESETSRTLIDISSYNPEVYCTYPDAFAVEQLNNQRVSPSSRYPRINTVIRRASPSCNAENSNAASSCFDFSKDIEHNQIVQQKSGNPAPPVVVITREGRGTFMNPSLNRDPRKNFLWENFDRINRD